jgi:signal transduction histidine kinase
VSLYEGGGRAGELSGAGGMLLPLAEIPEDRQHIVQFYERDDLLADVVTGFLGDGLGAGDALVAIATPEHQLLFAQRLRDGGFDPAAAVGRGQLTFLDAQATLDAFMAGSIPDSDRFQEVVGEALRRCAQGGTSGRVRAYGEMVDLLWRQGNRAAALRLEELWNDLQGAGGFSLLCAYLMGSALYGQPSDLHRICANHTHVLRGAERLDLDATAAPPQHARALAAEIVHRKEVEQALRGSVRELRRKEQELSARADRTERLMKITAAIADAVTPEQVYTALVDEVGAALGASSAGLWLVDEEGREAHLVRSMGYLAERLDRIARFPLAAEGRIPVVDCVRERQPIWIDSQPELLERYPHLAAVVTPGRSYRVSCLPIVVRGAAIGGLGFTFEGRASVDRDQRDVLLLVARYSAQALERLRLLELERRSREQAEAFASRLEHLYGLVRAVIHARRVEEVFDPALDAIERALETKRCSILLFDEEGVMRFRAWRGLSEAYRAAVDGHSPWRRDDLEPTPIFVPDVETDPTMSVYLPVFREAGIGSLAFFPLVAGGRLIGKFMVYYDRPQSFSPTRLNMAGAIANHVAAACARFASVAQLEQTVRFNEMFAGILGHDLRNPLGAIMASAELALRRDEGGKVAKPISRILSSGHRMARMIDQLLDFTRVRVGAGIPLAAERRDLHAVLRQVTDELEPSHPGTLHLTLSGRGEGSFDVDRMSQVFSNLLGNALQHGLPEAGVTVRADGEAPDRLQVEVHNAGAIPPGLLGKLFEPMTGGERRRDGSQGLGLGLYISKQIVEAHGGHIEVRSSEAAGTTFVVVLPREGGRP